MSLKSPAGQPSTTTPIPAPWDSPQVVIVNIFPNVEPAMLSCSLSLHTYRELFTNPVIYRIVSYTIRHSAYSLLIAYLTAGSPLTYCPFTYLLPAFRLRLLTPGGSIRHPRDHTAVRFINCNTPAAHYQQALLIIHLKEGNAVACMIN